MLQILYEGHAGARHGSDGGQVMMIMMKMIMMIMTGASSTD